MDDTLSRLDQLDNLADSLDYDYSVNETFIADMAQFRQQLLEPYQGKDKQIFYRGERIGSLKRPLLPTLFRDRNALIGGEQPFVDLDAEKLLSLYRNSGSYLKLFRAVFGDARKYCMYDLCAFSQHYLELSPFIDFTKSLYVALSFGLKGKHAFTDDPILYTVEVSDRDHYTADRVTAECWLNDYHVRIYNYEKRSDLPPGVERTSPEAKIIDIATNDRMKFQQGVFLLLDNFNLVNHLYLTKNVRDSVTISKYILSRELCPALTDMVEQYTPWYSFDKLLDVGEGIRSAVNLSLATP